MICERSRIDALSYYWLWKLGLLLSSDDGADSLWRWLASELGLRNDEVETFQSSLNPGYSVIKHWSRHNDDCSIRVLRNILGDVLNRPDLVEVIDKARRS